MDWIECRWINKYRGWALNCYDAVRSATLNKEFGNKYRKGRNDRSEDRLLELFVRVKKLGLTKNQRKKVDRSIAAKLRKCGISLEVYVIVA